MSTSYQLTLEDQAAIDEATVVLRSLGRKVEDEDLYEHPELIPGAIVYVSNYDGDFEFMLSLKSDATLYGFRKWSPGKFRGALNCLRAAVLRADRAAAPAPVVEGPVGNDVPAGTYTVAFDDGSHVTLRVKKHWVEEEAKKGVKVVQYLSGADNESSYTGFAFLNAGRLRVWRKFEGQLERQVLAFDVVAGNPAQAGEAYALHSNNCFRCGRKLTVPASIHRGLGPECAGKWGH